MAKGKYKGPIEEPRRFSGGGQPTVDRSVLRRLGRVPTGRIMGKITTEEPMSRLYPAQVKHRDATQDMKRIDARVEGKKPDPDHYPDTQKGRKSYRQDLEEWGKEQSADTWKPGMTIETRKTVTPSKPKLKKDSKVVGAVRRRRTKNNK